MELCKTRHKRLVSLLERAYLELERPCLSDTRRRELARQIRLELRYYDLRLKNSRGSRGV